MALDISKSEVSRVERNLSPRVPFVVLARFAAVVGLDLPLRTYAGAGPLRHPAHSELLGDLREILHPSLRWATEVPMPIPGDQRAWDGMIIGRDWRFGVEAETAPRDAQALARRLATKQRDGLVDGLLLVLRDTWRTREFLEAAEGELRSLFPTGARAVLRSLRRGDRPAGNAVIVLHRRRPVAPKSR